MHMHPYTDRLKPHLRGLHRIAYTKQILFGLKGLHHRHDCCASLVSTVVFSVTFKCRTPYAPHEHKYIPLAPLLHACFRAQGGKE